MGDAFISFVQPNRLTAFRIHDLLQSNGLVSWIAIPEAGGIPPGLAFEAELVKAIAGSRTFVLVYSRYCNQSENIVRELRHRRDDQPTIVFRMDNSTYAPALSWYLKDLQYIDAAAHANAAYPHGAHSFDRAISQLVAAIRSKNGCFYGL